MKIKFLFYLYFKIIILIIKKLKFFYKKLKLIIKIIINFIKIINLKIYNII